MASRFTSSGYITSGESKIFFEREGNPTGRTILFIHGLGGTTNAFQTLISDLQEFSLLRLDLAGHGRSSTPSMTSVDSYVQDCEAAILHFGIQDVLVVAHSFGGFIALHLASKRPDIITSLVLFGPFHTASQADLAAFKGRAELVKQRGMEAIADSVVSRAFAAESFNKRKAAVAFAREMLTRQNPKGYALAIESFASGNLVLSTVKAKTLVVSGEEDKVSPFATGQVIVREIGDHARQETMKGVGHWHMLEDPEESAQLIKFFFRRND